MFSSKKIQKLNSSSSDTNKSKVTSFSSSETKKSIVSERKALDSNCRDNNDEFKVQFVTSQPSSKNKNKDSNDGDNNDKFKVQFNLLVVRHQYKLSTRLQGSLSSLTANINNIKAELQENLKNVKTDFQVAAQ